MLIVDGGYLSWLYGSNHWARNGWTGAARSRFSRRAGALILIDSRTSARKEFYPLYKQNRQDRRDADPMKAQQKEEVVRFTSEVLLEDPSLSVFTAAGLEADDLVAIAVIRQVLPIPIQVFGVDKDLLQLPTGSLNISGSAPWPATIQKFAQKQAVLISGLIQKPKDILLMLSCMGDKSDGIPRLIPPRQLDIMVDIMLNNWPFHRAYHLLGQDFLRNLYLAVLPGPWVFNPVPSPELVLELVESDSWYDQQIHHGLLEGITKQIDSIKEVIDEW